MGAQTTRFSYVLPDPASYRDWSEFDGDLACMKQAGYDAVELQIADPIAFTAQQVRRSLDAVGYTLCAFQTGSSYSTLGNCLSTPDAGIRQRTTELLSGFVDLATRFHSVIVFGSLQGRLKDEPDKAVGEARIAQALTLIGRRASEKKATIAFEPVNHLEVGFHNTIGESATLVRRLNLPGLRLMVDTFHMNIEEQDMFAALHNVRDILTHVHLSETNRDALGLGHWPVAGFLRELQANQYRGFVSVGVYNTRLTRHESIRRCMDVLRQSMRS